MPTKTFHVRRRRRGARLLRLLGIAAALVAAAALVVYFVGGEGPGKKDEEERLAQVAFAARRVTPVAQGRKPRPAALRAERQHLVRLLNGIYQSAFVDPARFRTGSFTDVRRMLVGPARKAFVKDVDVLTIGPARTDAERVRPSASRADLTIYFDDRGRPKFAVAAVRFVATATMRTAGAPPLRIEQDATLSLQRTTRGWRVFAWKAAQRQRSLGPTPTASPTR